MGWRHLEAEHEPDGLRAWRGQGAVLLQDSCQLGLSTALLLERCEPGTPLSTVRPEAEQDLIVASLLRRLWQAPTAGLPFRPLHAMCQAWVTEFDQRLAALPNAPDVVDPGLARAGAELFLAFARSAEHEVLLCTDLHAGNVLAARREPWVVIDPKPFAGDLCYDALQHLLNCAERLVDGPAGLAQRMADLLDLDGDRVRQWRGRGLVDHAQEVSGSDEQPEELERAFPFPGVHGLELGVDQLERPDQGDAHAAEEQREPGLGVVGQRGIQWGPRG